jgi:hypothetical protein
VYVAWAKGKKLTIRVAETSTVAQVIIVSMKHYAAQKLQPPMQSDPNLYTLRMVDDDGTPDEDFPGIYKIIVFFSFSFFFHLFTPLYICANTMLIL